MAIDPTATRLNFSSRGHNLIGQEMFRVADDARLLESVGRAVIHMELGALSTLPPVGLLAYTDDNLWANGIGYTSPAGIVSLRKAVASQFSLHNTAHNVVITPANLLISQFLDITCGPDDTVALFTPAFPTYLAASRYANLKTLEILLSEDSGWQLTEDSINEATQAGVRAVIVNSANNPTGAVYDPALVNELTEKCERRGIWLLRDDTYQDLHYKRGYSQIRASGSDRQPHVISIGSLSKIFAAPGFRVGFAIGAEAVIEKFALANSTQISCLPEFVQQGCAKMMPRYREYTASVVEYYEPIIAECVNRVNASGILHCTLPQAAFYLFINIELTGMDSAHFAMGLLQEEGVAVTPGGAFGQRWTNYIRIVVGARTKSLEGIQRIIKFARECRKDGGI